MVSYSTYMDASGKPEHGPEEWCVVAGFISTVHRWDDFEARWNDLLNRHEIPYLQMSALHSRKPPYGDAKWNDPQYMVSFLSEAGKLIETHVLGWAADAVKNDVFSQAKKDRPGVKKYTNAYGLCGTSVALRLQMNWIHFHRPEVPSIEHFFEEGDKGVGNIAKVFSHCGMAQPIVRPGKPRFDGAAIRHYVHFQAADWLAFETRKLAIKCYPDKPVIRPYLRTLLRNIPGRAAVWTYEDLIHFCDRKRERGQMQ
jgi:hypothetical protein